MAREFSLRSGRYITQPSGYEAFIPAKLPPDPPITIDDEIWQSLSKADRALGRLDGSTDSLPNPELFVFMYVRKEAVLSSQIEGTQASLIDVLEFEAERAEDNAPKDVGEVVNYLDAMNFGLSRLKELPLSLRLLCEIHERLLAGVRGSERAPGEFRRSQNWIGPAGCSLSNAQFIPPPPYEMDQALGDLERFLHDVNPMPYLVKAGIAHVQFETIHPFLDGNGRMGRLLITFLLCQQKILQRPLLYLSYFFKKNRSEYYERLQRVREKGDWEGWLKFFLRGVYDVAQDATKVAREIVQLREQHREHVRKSFGKGAGRAMQLLEHLYLNPIISVNSAKRELNMAFANANALVRGFVDAGFLVEMTGGKRNRLFSYDAYLELLSDDGKRDAPATLNIPAVE